MPETPMGPNQPRNAASDHDRPSGRRRASSTGSRRRSSTAPARAIPAHPSSCQVAQGMVAPSRRNIGSTANRLTASSISTSALRSEPVVVRLTARPATNTASTPSRCSTPDTPRTSIASSTVNSSIGPCEVEPWASPKRSDRPPTQPATMPRTTAPPTCHEASRAACPAVRGAATAMASSTNGSARPSLAPDSIESTWRVCSGTSCSAGRPVTTLEARTGSVGQVAAPSSRATPSADPSNQAARPADTRAIAGIASSSRITTGRSWRRTAANG